MPRTRIAIFTNRDEATRALSRAQPGQQGLLIGPTNQIEFRGPELPTEPLRSGPDEDFFVVCYTPDPIIGPQPTLDT